MRTWKIEKYHHDDVIIELLKQYSQSLSDVTFQSLKVTITPLLFNNQTHYLFKVHDFKNELFSITIFDICVADIEKQQIDLTVQYYDGTTSTSVNVNNLEGVIDSIISSEKMGNYIGYLISITKKETT